MFYYSYDTTSTTTTHQRHQRRPHLNQPRPHQRIEVATQVSWPFYLFILIFVLLLFYYSYNITSTSATATIMTGLGWTLQVRKGSELGGGSRRDTSQASGMFFLQLFLLLY